MLQHRVVTQSHIFICHACVRAHIHSHTTFSLSYTPLNTDCAADAEYAVNLNSANSRRIATAVASKSIDSKVCQPAQTEILRLLASGAVQRFIASPAFQEFKVGLAEGLKLEAIDAAEADSGDATVADDATCAGAGAAVRGGVGDGDDGDSAKAKGDARTHTASCTSSTSTTLSKTAEEEQPADGKLLCDFDVEEHLSFT